MKTGKMKLRKKIKIELSGIKTLDGNRKIYFEKRIPFINPKILIHKLLLIPSREQNYQLETATHN